MSPAPTVRRVLRTPFIGLHILAGISVAWLVLRPRRDRVASTRSMVIWSRILCRLLGVRITVHGLPRAGETLFIANHISWLDIFCIATVCPTHFLAKSEIADWPVFGWLCRLIGTLFIRRGGDNGASEAAEQLAWRLRQGGRILVFPEGTSTSGETVKRFHPRLLQAAIHTHCPVQAIAVRYPQGAGINTSVPFVGEDRLLPHLWRLLGEQAIDAELHFCETLYTAGQSRDIVARQAHAQISAALQQPAKTAVRRKYRLPFKRLGTRQNGYFRR